MHVNVWVLWRKGECPARDTGMCVNFDNVTQYTERNMTSNVPVFEANFL